MEINEQLSLGKKHEAELSNTIADLNRKTPKLLAKYDIEDKLLEHNNKIFGYTRLYDSKVQSLT